MNKELNVNNLTSNQAGYKIVMEDDHVHGPGCGHHVHARPTPKYNSCKDVPELDVIATFNASNEGARWAKNAGKLVNALYDRASEVPAGEVVACVVNVEAYKWMLTSSHFRRGFQPATPNQLAKSGLVGMLLQKVLVMTDAQIPETLTEHLAYYWCSPVLAVQEETIGTVERVTEVETIEAETLGQDGEGPAPALCEDEGCDHHGTLHACDPPAPADTTGAA